MWQLLKEHIEKHVALTDEEFEKVCSFLTFRRYRRKQFILQEGDISRCESFILKGCCRIYDTDSEGHEHVLQFGVEGWWVGDLYSYLTQTPSSCNIDCIEDCETVQLTLLQQEALYKAVPLMERFFRIIIQNAFIASQRRVLHNLSKSGAERYKDFIEKYPHIEQRVPDRQVASYLGLTPQSLSRIRARKR